MAKQDDGYARRALTRTLQEILDLVADLKKEGRFDVLKEDLGETEDQTTDAVRMLIIDPQIRPEHRARIYTDLVSNRERLIETKDPRIVDLVFWSEHVATLYDSHVKRRVSTFHYARALEATCRRCGYELLGVVGRGLRKDDRHARGDGPGRSGRAGVRERAHASLFTLHTFGLRPVKRKREAWAWSYPTS